MFLQKFILISLLIAFPNEVVSDIFIDFPEITEEDLIRKPNNPWALQMVQNIFWDRSKAYMGIIRTKITDEPAFHLGKTPQSAHDSRGLPYERGLWEDGEMSYFVGMNQPNMLINFTTTDDDTAFCHIGIIPDEVLDLVLEEYKNYGDTHCVYERKPYSMDSPHENFIQTKKKYAFCSLDELIKEKLPFSKVPTWILANGTYNPPSKTPDCLYDFHDIAKDTNEYNFFSYCARAYWYNGRNYNDQDERVKKLRKDWFMYMFEGKVTCSQTERLQENMDMLKKGYRIELVHHYDFYSYRFFDQMYYCPQLRAKLAKYEDNRQDGRFFFAGIVGAGQLENFILRSYWGHTNNKTNNWHVEPKKFWDKETYTTLYKEMDLDLKACYLHYHNLGRRYRTKISNYTNEGERINPETPSHYYNIQLRVVHFCTDRGMRENLAFDIKMRPDQVPEGIFEDNDLEIDLTNKRLIRPTGQTFCAYGQNDCRKKKPTELPPEPRSADGVNNVRKEGELVKNAECDDANEYPRSRDCPFASICIDKDLRCKFGPLGIQKQDPICRQQTAEQGYFDNLVNIFNRAQNFYDRAFKCEESILPAKKDGEDCLGIDRLCRENAFCARIGINKTTETKSECRQLRARELDETCYMTDECMPGAICQRDYQERQLWGKCVNAKKYQCPNRGYRTPCKVDKCPNGTKKSETCSPTYGEFIYFQCEKSTTQGFEWDPLHCAVPPHDTTVKRIFGTIGKLLSECDWVTKAFLNALDGKPPPTPKEHNVLKCIEAYSEAATHHCCL